MSALRPSLVAVISVLTLAGLLVLPLPASAAPAVSRQDAIHEVMSGDDLRLIAGYYYGDTRQWERIWQVNRDQIKNPNRIEQGSLLRIPDVSAPTISYADYLARVRGPRAPVEAAPAPGAPPSEAAPTLAAPMPSIPQGEPLPPPSGPVTLQYRPTKGFIQTARITFSAKMMTEAKGQFMPQRATVRGRLHTVVEGVGADGMARLTLSLSDVDEDAGGAPYRLADIGLPEPGETLRLSVSRLNKVLQVEGKRLGTMSYFAIPFHLPYPETPTGIGGSWQFEQPANIELDGKKETATVRCTLMGRERFRSEETYRIGCESTASTPPGKILRGHQSGEIAAVVRARDGTLMYTEISIRLLIEGLGTKLSGDTHIVFEVEAPSAPAQAAAPGGPSAPAAPSTEPGKRP